MAEGRSIMTKLAMIIYFVRKVGWLLSLSLSPAGCWMLDAGCWMLDAGCRMLDAGCWMLDAGCWMLNAVCCTEYAYRRKGIKLFMRNGY